MRLFDWLVNRRMNILTAAQNGTVDVESEIRRLIAGLKENEVIAEFARHPGWREIDDKLGDKAIGLLRQLPRLILDGKINEATRASGYIMAINDLLGIVNLTLLESQRCSNIIDKYITVKQRLEESKNAE